MKKLLPAGLFLLTALAVAALAHEVRKTPTAQSQSVSQQNHEHPAPSQAPLAQVMKEAVENKFTTKTAPKKPEVYTVSPAEGAMVLLRFKTKDGKVIVSFNDDGSMEVGPTYIKNTDAAGRDFIGVITKVWAEQIKASCAPIGVPTVRPGHAEKSAPR